MIAAALAVAFLSVTGAVDGSCKTSPEPQVESLGDVVNGALAKAPVVYRDGGAWPVLAQDELDRREKAIHRATKANVPQPGAQIGNGRCAALALEAVMASFPGAQPKLTEIVDYAKSQGWSEIGEMNGGDLVRVAEHYGYAAKQGGMPRWEEMMKLGSDRQPLLVGVSGNRSGDPTLSQYGGHMLIATGAYEVDGVRYVVGKDPNHGGDVAWRYDDLSAATNETILVHPRS